MEAASTPRNDGSSAMPPPVQQGTVLFREIHKNAWLKKLPTSEKRSGAYPKKGERVWVVFCVHDDVEAFLETYNDQKLAVTHKPDWFESLNSCIHISPTICPQDEEYEFVITLPSDLVRLTAPSWDAMMEWVDTIRSKLQEMKIFSPRENIYSKMPEARMPLFPTRDPNSPLPLPPAGPSSLLPGIEPIQQTSDNSDSNSISASGSSTEVSSSSDSSEDNSTQPPERVEYDDVSLEVGSSTTSLYITQSEPQLYARPNRALNRATSVHDSPLVYSSSSMSSPSTAGSRQSHGENVTVIEVSNTFTSPISPAVFNFNFQASHTELVETEDDGEANEGFFTPPLTPAMVERDAQPSISLNIQPEREQNNLSQNGNGNSLTEAAGSSNNSHYECVFLPVSDGGLATPSPVSRSRDTAPGSRNSISQRIDVPERIPQSRNEVSDRAPQPRGDAPERPVQPRSRSAAARARVPFGNVEMEARLQPAPHPYRQHAATSAPEVLDIARLTLREQQVLQLRREKLHPGGVRLQLRRKDCTGSIALVDAFGGVWISGWKQREHPMLYNALHIGDQLISTAGVLVHCASDAHKLIRAATGLYVEFVIRRVPFGRVFAIRREIEGQSLGIIQEGNTAVIRDIVPNGLAARHGLSAKVQTCDSLSLTSWTMTEINGRPLNLFFKDNEIRDRLNAIGREISILVQPYDLVKQLKKQLKSLRSYKDYIVQ